MLSVAMITKYEVADCNIADKMSLNLTYDENRTIGMKIACYKGRKNNK